MKKTIPKASIVIPDSARIAYEGQLFTVYQWPQTMFDGSEKTFEMLKRPDTLQVIAVVNDKLVMVKEEQPGTNPYVGFPGGRSEPTDVDWLEGAKREMREETGMGFAQWRLLFVSQPAPKIEWFVPVFLATELIETHSPELDSGEKIEVVMKSFEEVAEIALALVDPGSEYLLPVFTKFRTLKELLDAPEYTGIEVDR